jgi:hypothetical protein
MADDVCSAVGDRVLSREEWAQHVGADFEYEAEYAGCKQTTRTPPVTVLESADTKTVGGGS